MVGGSTQAGVQCGNGVLSSSSCIWRWGLLPAAESRNVLSLLHTGDDASHRTAASQPVMPMQLGVDVGEHRHFGDLFVELLTQTGVLCVGLYRPTMHMGQTFYYPYTNPAPGTPLMEGDRAIVLQPLPPSIGQHDAGDALHAVAAAATGQRQQTSKSSTGQSDKQHDEDIACRGGTGAV